MNDMFGRRVTKRRKPQTEKQREASKRNWARFQVRGAWSNLSHLLAIGMDDPTLRDAVAKAVEALAPYAGSRSDSGMTLLECLRPSDTTIGERWDGTKWVKFDASGTLVTLDGQEAPIPADRNVQITMTGPAGGGGIRRVVGPGCDADPVFKRRPND
jgi:hypothetical protein